MVFLSYIQKWQITDWKLYLPSTNAKSPTGKKINEDLFHIAQRTPVHHTSEKKQ